ncbi:energy transducer TonB [Hymenobacter volaticus]|uniref:TonB family protein n=1 Tax=Hymenobacter volaticus TaxID=2932254 RepID=A0ABY4G0G2_9BACT|nr:energy transducer TonB [Hymenobacter volaticus]UOQ64337.1 TonB family protein [Hymenobacter volaticus]
MSCYTLLIVGCLLTVNTKTAAQSIDAYFKAQPGSHSDVDFGNGLKSRTDTVRGTNGAAAIIRYYASGQKQEEIPYLFSRKNELHGTQTRWFENGRVQATEQYANNQRHGQLLTYYPNGTLRRREEYKQGKQVKAECFAADGKSIAYFDYLQFPEYPGGLLKLLGAIQSNTEYPKEALRNEEQGKVLVDFVVSSRGVVQDARVRKSVSPLLDQEALRVVNSLRGWNPARLDGELTDVLFTLPVTFTIN